MKKLIFVTNNQNKLKEIISKVQGNIDIMTLQDLNFFDDIPETAETLEENAIIKSSTIYNKFKVNCFADDTGLEIEALDMKPGVYSARYGGQPHNHEKNMDRVLRELKGVRNRKARFRTVISLLWEEQAYLFEGIVDGTILHERRGEEGFGYDPIFLPDGYDQSFAEMDLKLKNEISHRGIAVRKLIDFLNDL